MPDFTNCKRLLGNAYADANSKKLGIAYQGDQYMLKFPPSGKTICPICQKSSIRPT